MASIYDLKPRFQALLRPLVGRLASSGITANQVTAAAAFISVATGLVLLASPGSRAALLLVPAVLFVRMALNAIDGMLAREHGQTSRLGALLNELGDVVSDAALYLPLAVALAPFGANGTLIVLFVVAALLTEFAGLAGLLVGASRRYDGPMGKSDRAAAVGILTAALALGLPGGWWLDMVMLALIALSLATMVNRARGALSEAEPRGHA